MVVSFVGYILLFLSILGTQITVNKTKIQEIKTLLVKWNLKNSLFNTFSNFTGILFFVLIYKIYLSLLLKMINVLIWPAEIMDSQGRIHVWSESAPVPPFDR